MGNFKKIIFVSFVFCIAYCNQSKSVKQYPLDPLIYADTVKKTDRDAFKSSSFLTEFESARRKMYSVLKEGEFKDLENFLDQEYFNYSEEGGGINRALDFDGKKENLYKIQQVIDKNDLLDALKAPKIHRINISKDPVQYIGIIYQKKRLEDIKNPPLDVTVQYGNSKLQIVKVRRMFMANDY